MSDKIDLNELVWERDEELYPDTDKVHSIRYAYIGGDIEKIGVGIVKIGQPFGEARLAVFMKDGTVFGNEWLTEWKRIDELFGRREWRTFLLEYELDYPEV